MQNEQTPDEICRECEGDNGDYVTLCDYHASLTARVKELEETLYLARDTCIAESGFEFALLTIRAALAHKEPKP
jgi:hypothetical protein